MKKTCDLLSLSLLTLACFLAPGALFALFNRNFVFSIDATSLIVFPIFALFLPLVPRVLSIAILAFFALLEFIQFAHIFYFNAPLSPFAFSLIWGESGEIVETALAMFPAAILPIAVVVLPYGALIWGYKKYGGKKLAPTLQKTAQKSTIPVIALRIFATAIIIIMLCILPHKALYKTDRINNFLPANNAVSLLNSLNAFTGWAFVILKNGNPAPQKFEPYAIEKVANERKNHNIVIILGESQNAAHYGILGYERETTPRLSALSKTDPNFYATAALSSAVLTRVAMNSFFNIAYLPNDPLHIMGGSAHLVRLAHEAGYTTYYLSNQTISELAALSPAHLSVAKTKENHLTASNQKGDLALLDFMDEFGERFKAGRNFIVIHQRSSHSPYDATYRAFPEASIYPTKAVPHDVYKLNSYDNSVVFNDHIIAEIFGRFERMSGEIPSFAFFLPDHGEAMGKDINGQPNGIWGHSVLDPVVAQIPFISTIYGDVKSLESYGVYAATLADFTRPTQYEVAKLIARLLGYEVKNPHEKEGVFFVNGVDIAGNAGYFEVHRDKDGAVEFIERH